MRKTILIIIAILAVLGGGAGYFFTHYVVMPAKTESDGVIKYKYDQVAIQKHVGFAENDQDGNLKEISKDDPRVVEISQIALQWGRLISDRSYQTVSGVEEYGLYTKDLIDRLNKQGDAENTIGSYQTYDLIAKGSNYNVINVIIFPDGKAFAQMESDLEIVATNDPEGVSGDWGFETGEVGETHHYQYGLDLKDVDGHYMIDGVGTYQTDAIIVD
ncbi:MAG TPA: hypothetical protein VM577_07340 [Anaerovoracaceae bacterium]|nr:hypothetical protein [Anaerovoracaceae bacterium]